MSLAIRCLRDGSPLPAEYGDAVLSWLANFGGARPYGTLESGAALVRDGHDGGYRIWSISDNGGELNVQPVNDDPAMRSVPFTVYDRVVNPFTLAYRIHQVMRGREIEWSALFPEFDGVMRPDQPVRAPGWPARGESPA